MTTTDATGEATTTQWEVRWYHRPDPAEAEALDHGSCGWYDDGDVELRYAPKGVGRG